MKYVSVWILMLACFTSIAQNVGIGTASPQQQLDVNGAIRIGSTSTLNAGTIRYNAGKFEGSDGGSWKSLESLPAGAIIMAPPGTNANITSTGFSLYSTATYTGSLRIGNYPGSWVLNTVSTSGVPIMYYHCGVWTGTKMVVYNNTNLCYSYDTLANSWTTSSANTVAGFLGRDNATAVWTGTELIIWGGRNPNTLAVYQNGCKYNPTTDTWTAIADAPEKRWMHSAVWTGNKMIIWGGNDETYGVQLSTGMIYDAGTNAWSYISSFGAPSARRQATAVWTGTKMIVFGGEQFNGTSTWLSDGKIYDLAGNSWGVMASHYTVTTPSACWDGTSMIYSGSQQNAGYLYGAKYNITGNTWTPLPGTINSIPRYTSVWTGNFMLCWGSGYSAKFYPNVGSGDAFSPTGLLGIYYYIKN